jgi:hypothetical protein
MNRFARRARSAVTLAALTLGVMSAAVPLAEASSVPFQDPNVVGWLTFCNRQDKPVTSGSIDTAPFAWKTISSAAPPAGYRNSSARATLYAYQPIQYVDPGDWSGEQLTAGSIFTNPQHPVVQATDADLALLGFTQAYPAHWDGLVEIRMMYTAINQAQLQNPYGAAVLRISGSTWTEVEGGGGSCSQGQGTSVETKLLPKKDLDKQQTDTPSKKSSTGAGGSSSNSNGSANSGGSGRSGNSGTSGGSRANGSASLADSSGGMGAGAMTGIAVAAAALVALVIGAIAWRRRRAAG